MPAANRRALTVLTWQFTRKLSRFERQIADRAAFYIDAFNLYYAISELQKPHLKWLNISSMCAKLLPQESEELTRVVYCTAYKRHSYDKLTRHQKYIRALETTGVRCVFGHAINEDMECHDCDHTWVIEREKETDVNLALHLVVDGLQGLYDHAYLITSDSDQAGAANMFAAKCRNLKLTTVAPPGRNFSVHILKHTQNKIALTEAIIGRSLFPQHILNADKSAVVVTRPSEYDPPQGWTAPA